ncbi:MAG TPA: DNA-binding transcriptional regulator [Alphaproteobacteria bacterium]|nr:DNA-binding transcriptional regulator [Alphaproteobacteria bacterium]
MSDILDIAHDLAKDLHAVGAMDMVTMRKMDVLCLPPRRSFNGEDVRRIRAETKLSQPVFAVLLNVSSSTVAQWEQGLKQPSGAAARLLDVIERKGIQAIV